MSASKTLLQRFGEWLLGPPPPRRTTPDTNEGEEPSAGEAVPGPDEIVRVPIEDAIDLHTFAPRDVASVVEEYLREARAAGFREVRVIHGKGKGVQRRIVQGVLGRHADVESFRDAPGSRGGWGATIVILKP